MPILLPLVLLLQTGSQVPMGSAAPVPLAPLPIPRRSSVVKSAPQPAPQPPSPEMDRLTLCLAKTRRDPGLGLAEAHAWLAEGGGPMAQVRANQCLGMALTDVGNFTDAEQAFAAAVSGIPQKQAGSAVPLMAMAGNAALADGKPQEALGWFNKAVAVTDYPDKAMMGGIQADRARALVALNRGPEATGALVQARLLAPMDSEVWLLSATLARREDKLAEAQGYIQKAHALNPRDPRIGLEAGVIAVLSGHDDAARASWQSVIKVAPGGAEAKTAQGYLDQLAADTAAAAPQPAKPQEKAPK